eukprot:TRINITY_DN2980_c0_g1_i7.p1 TRINITY_DN2980_c0_g1~~TRINITY_DN2980_c0_g1_i7.p1  ORF type:complete len:288 (+),score=64.56 TRINITY_DN2980_c0_g1_i7:211-1074(+)
MQMDYIYSRCAGSLPRRERELIKEMVNEVQLVDSFEKFWITIGMDTELVEREDLLRKIGNYLEYLEINIEKWEKGNLPSGLSAIKVPKLDPGSSNIGILSVRNEIDIKKQVVLAEEQLKHRGYPDLNKRGKLDELTCNYPLCGKKFKYRDQLFRHLKKVIPKERMHFGHHQNHWALRVKDTSSTKCECCGENFETTEECIEHYVTLGVPGYTRRVKKEEKVVVEEKKDALVDEYENPNECVVCMDAPRTVVNIPCGHMVCCEACGNLVKTCPICRSAVSDILKVFYS